MTSIDTVNDLPPRVQYVASAAQTLFPYPFPIFSDGDLVVDVDGTPAALNVAYTVAGEGDDLGGNVTWIGAAFVGGEIVTIYRDIAIERDTDISQNGPWSSTTYNDEMDKIFLLLQQLKANGLRALRLPITAAVTDADIELDPVAFANKYLSFDANGKPVPAVLTSAALTAAAITAVLTASTTDQDAILALLRERTDTTPGLDSLERSAVEITDGVTPANYAYPEGDVRRYAPTLAFAGYNWKCFGQTATRVSDTAFTVPGDHTDRYPLTSRVRLTDSGTGVYMARVRNSTFGAGVTRIVCGPDGNTGLLGNVPNPPTSLSLEVAAGIGQSTTLSYKGSGSNQGVFVWNRDEGATAYAELQVHVGKGASSTDGSGETIFGSSSGVALRATPTTRTNALLNGGSGYGGGGVGGAGAQIVMHTGLAIPIIFGTSDLERLVITAGTSSILFFNAEDAARFHSPRADDIGGVYLSFYEDDRTTRKGLFGFDGSGSNNTMRMANEETGANIQLAAPQHIWLSHGDGNTGAIFIDNIASTGLFGGTGSPNGAITANMGSKYHNRTGGANVSTYTKESGTGTNTGWVGK